MATPHHGISTTAGASTRITTVQAGDLVVWTGMRRNHSEGVVRTGLTGRQGKPGGAFHLRLSMLCLIALLHTVSFTQALLSTNSMSFPTPYSGHIGHGMESTRRNAFALSMSVFPTSLTSLSASTRSSLFRKNAVCASRIQARPSSTARHMVLTTPESIIEQASTQSLLDDLIDESVRTSARRPIMMQFDPSSGWIWRRWQGTVFSETWHSAVAKMAWATIMFFFFRANPSVKENLSGFSILWGQLLSVTTFTLTFFLNQSYALWRKCYELSRRLQGRLNDLGMTLAAHAARKTPTSPNESSTYTGASRQLLELISRYIRMFNLLTYASFTRSHRPILTPRGMRRLTERGLLTATERQILVDAEIPATQRHNAVVLWITRAFIEGRQAGHFVGGAGFEDQFLEKIHVIRAQYGAIGDELQGRMPLAYAHIVQVLVDVVLWMYPIMAFSTGMSPFLGVLGTGLLTMFYQGLFDLAKQFLDPYDNENYGKGEDPLCVDTLVAETNSGSVRWMNAFEEQPYSAQRLRDGELFDYLLPLRGYSVDELTEMEAEKVQKEKEQQEKREREEVERRKREEEEAERLKESEQRIETMAVIETVANATTLDGANNMTTAKNEIDVLDDDTESAKIDRSTEMEEVSAVHKVYTLEDGTPVSLKEPEEEECIPVQILSKSSVTSELEETAEVISGKPPRSPSKADVTGPVLGLASTSGISQRRTQEPLDDSRTKQASNKEPSESTATNGAVNSRPINSSTDGDLLWFHEVGPDGKEYQLKELSIDGEPHEEPTPVVPVHLTPEEHMRQVNEFIEAAERERRETEAILNAPPGADSWDPRDLNDDEKPNVDVAHKEKVDNSVIDNNSLDVLQMDEDEVND